MQPQRPVMPQAPQTPQASKGMFTNAVRSVANAMTGGALNRQIAKNREEPLTSKLLKASRKSVMPEMHSSRLNRHRLQPKEKLNVAATATVWKLWMVLTW